MVGLLAGIDFSPDTSEFQTLLKNGDLVAGIDYTTLEVTRHEAKDKHFLKTMFHGAASKQGWHQGLYAEIVVKKAMVNDKPVIIVLPTSAVQESKDNAEKNKPKKWWQFWR